MADAKQARRAAVDLIKKLAAENKDVRGSLDELQRLSKERLTALQKLEAQAKALKPKPAATAAIGDAPELRKLLQSSRLTEMSGKFESARKDVDTSLSPTGRQRSMLNNLIKFATVGGDQHTGGRAGEVSGTRSSTRLIEQALKALLTGEKTAQHAGKSWGEVPVRAKPLTDKSRVNELPEHVKGAKEALTAIEQTVKAMDQFAAAFDAGSDLALKGFAGADQATAA